MLPPATIPTVARPLPAFVQAALPVESAEHFAFRRQRMAERKAKRHAAKPHWRPLYGTFFVLEADGMLDADGKPTKVKVVRKFSHNPGDINESSGGKHTYGGYADLPRYMVQPNHALKRI